MEDFLRVKFKEIGAKVVKLNSVGFNGLPDRMILFKGGIILFVELKSPTGRTRKLQKVVHRILIDYGFRVEIVNSKANVLQLVEEYREVNER